MNKMTFIATGDAFVTRRIPAEGYDGLEELQAIIGRHDVKFANLEMTFHDTEGHPAAESGGTWAMTDPRCLDDMKRYGFNLFTTANNHSGDYGEGGILATIRHLKERDMVFSGTGANMTEASRPCYLETRKGRVALISVSSSCHTAEIAGGQSGDVPGRAGLSPLRFTTTYHVPQEQFQQLQDIAQKTYINAFADYGIKLGYVNPKPEGVTFFGGYRFKLDEKNWVESAPLERDMVRLEAEIREARRQADVVLVSVHAHETDYDDFAAAPGFLEKTARRCIDAGANVIIGHGPHELRGVEVYNGGLIFYSLGNFIFQTETVSTQPYEAFDNKGVSAQTRVGEYMDMRSKNGTVGYITQENIWRSVMAGWTMENGKIVQAQFHPIDLGMTEPRTRRGTPVPGDEAVLRYLAKLSEPYGTHITIRDGVGYLDL